MSLSTDRNTAMQYGELISVPVAANAKMFAGGIACANATGFGTPGATATTLTFLGRTEGFVDNAGGADGAKTVLVRRKNAFKWKNYASDPITQADLFKTAYIVDDETVAKTNGTNTRSAAGKIVGIDSDGVWIEA